MKAISIHAPGDVRIIEIEKPVRREGEALLKLLYGGICGSDNGSYRGTYAYFDYPRIPGHELSAQVVEADPGNAFGVKEGMIVTVNPYMNCGHCYSCTHGLVNACMDNQTLGCQRDGAFSEYFTIPVERVYDGKGIDPRTLAAVEPFCISSHGVSRGQVGPGDRVLIVGAGTIGVLAAMAARAKGAKVWMSDVAQGKLDIAAALGVSDGSILNDSPEHFREQVAEITGGTGFEVTIEAVGLPSTFRDCIDAACFGGRMVLVGIGKQNLDFNFTLIQKKELNVFGSRNALKKDFLELIDLVSSGKVDLSRIITHEYAADDAPRAFYDLANNKGDMLKVVLDFTHF